MEDFSKEAEKQLETFEESDAKTALQQLICYPPNAKIDNENTTKGCAK